jgi:RimJ/RimL family protein N-acetyltransferase
VVGVRRARSRVDLYCARRAVRRRGRVLIFSGRARSASQDPYAYAIIDAADRAVGYVTLLRIVPDMRVIEVGHVLYSPALQRTPLGTETQYLLARYVFETLGYRRYEWKCDALNAASLRGAPPCATGSSMKGRSAST